ncbi:MAG: ScpA family protein [Candidatus Moranbacteria bacterium]|nr:ScpA family protein [Candidatus Moranbacteria bacterium]
MYSIKTPQFEGPLDVLLKLIEKNRLDITKLSLAEVAGEYLSYLEKKQKEGARLRNLSEFLWIASRLALLKSKALLPEFNLEKEEEEDIEELQFRLQEYRKFKKAADDLGGRLLAGNAKWSRREDPGGKKWKRSRENRINIDSKLLAKAYLNSRNDLTRLRNELEKEEKRLPDAFKIEEKIEEIKKVLSKRARVAFSKTISNCKDSAEVVTAFLSVLELVKQRTIILEQEALFSEMIIKNR